MRACWLKWVGRDWSISADYIWLNYSGANTALFCIEIVSLKCFGVKRLTPVNRLFRIPNKQLCRSLPGQNGQWDLVIDSKELNETSNMRPANLMIVKSVS